MASVNKVIIVGNLGRDPETRYLPSGDADVGDRLAARQVTRFRIPAEVADDDDLVYRCHDYPLRFWSTVRIYNARPYAGLTAAFSELTRRGARMPAQAASQNATNTAQAPNTAAGP